SFPMQALLGRKPKRRTLPWEMRRGLGQGESGTRVGHSWRLWLGMGPELHPASYRPWPVDIYPAALLLGEVQGNDGQATIMAPTTRVDGTSVGAGAKAMAAAGYIGAYRWAYDAATIADYVTREDGSPVVMGTNWYRSMFDPDPRTGRVEIKGPVDGGHA